MRQEARSQQDCSAAVLAVVTFQSENGREADVLVREGHR